MLLIIHVKKIKLLMSFLVGPKKIQKERDPTPDFLSLLKTLITTTNAIIKKTLSRLIPISVY